MRTSFIVVAVLITCASRSNAAAQTTAPRVALVPSPVSGPGDITPAQLKAAAARIAFTQLEPPVARVHLGHTLSLDTVVVIA